MQASDFDAAYKVYMIQAYPVIAQMTVDEFFYAMPDERDAAFERILNARNLRVTHEQYLADKGHGIVQFWTRDWELTNEIDQGAQ